LERWVEDVGGEGDGVCMVNVVRMILATAGAILRAGEIVLLPLSIVSKFIFILVKVLH